MGANMNTDTTIRAAILAITLTVIWLLFGAPAWIGTTPQSAGVTTGPIVSVPITPPTSITAGGNWQSSCNTVTSIQRIDFTSKSSQAGTLKIHRYFDPACGVELVPSPVQGTMTANAQAQIATSDAAPYQSFVLEIDNTSASTANINNTFAYASGVIAQSGFPTYTDQTGNQIQGVVPLCNIAPCTSANPWPTVFTASENHVGEWGNNQNVIKVAVPTTATTYAINKPIGGYLTIPNMTRVSGTAGASGTSGAILLAMLTFADAVGTIPFDIFFFDSLPATTANCADNGTFGISITDRDKTIGVTHLTDINASNPVLVVQNQERPLAYTIGGSTSAYACIVNRAAFAAAATANDATLHLKVLRQ